MASQRAPSDPHENQENVPPEETLMPIARRFAIACRNNNRNCILSILKMRKDRKVGPRIADDNLSPLHYAVLMNDHKAVQAVLAHFSSFSLAQTQRSTGYTALTLACSLDTVNPNIVGDIIEAKPKLAEAALKPLDIAISKGHFHLFKEFAERIQLPLRHLSNDPTMASKLWENPICRTYILSNTCSFWFKEIFLNIFISQPEPVYDSAVLSIGNHLASSMCFSTCMIITRQMLGTLNFIDWPARVPWAKTRLIKFFTMLFNARAPRFLYISVLRSSSLLQYSRPLIWEVIALFIDFNVANVPIDIFNIYGLLPPLTLRRSQNASLKNLSASFIRKALVQAPRFCVGCAYEEATKFLPTSIAAELLSLADLSLVTGKNQLHFHAAQ